MNNFYKFNIAMIIGVFILVVPSFSQVLEKKNDSTRLVAQADNCKAMRDFFIDSLVSANKPGSLILTKNSCPNNLVFSQYEVSNLSLNQRLDLITQVNPNYIWKYERGIMNLVPTKFIPELLNVKVKNFKVDNIYNTDLVIDKILQLPEIVENLKRLNIKQGIQFGGLQPPPSKRPPLEMVFEDITLQQILNEVVRKRGRGVWVYKESNYNGENNFSLEFLVQ